MAAEVPVWRALLQKQAENKTITRIAAEIGYSRPTVSAIINEIETSAYVTGTASTDAIAVRVISVYGNYICPHLTKRNERETWVSGEECRQYAHAEPPVSNRQAGEHWQACQGCAKLPPRLAKRAFVARGPKKAVAAVVDENQLSIDLTEDEK